MSPRLLADAELLVVTYLRTVADITTAVGTRVYTELPPTPTFPLLRVSRVGGIPTIRQHLDLARIQVDAWGTTKYQARTVAATAQAALHDMPAAYAAGVVTAVDDDLGLTWSPDPETDQARYLFAVAVTIHPPLS